MEKRGGGANSRPLKFPRTYPTSFRSRCTYAVHSLSSFPHSLRSTLVCLSDRFALRRVRSTLSGELRRGREATAAGQPVVRREPGIGVLDPEQPGAADHPRDNRLRPAYRLASRSNHDPHHVAIAPRRTHRPRVSSGGRTLARPSPPPQDGDRHRESPGVVHTPSPSSPTPAAAAAPASCAAAALVEDRHDRLPAAQRGRNRGYDHRDDDNHRRESHRHYCPLPPAHHPPALFLSRNVRAPPRGSSVLRATRPPSPSKVAVRRRSRGRRLAASRTPHRQVRAAGHRRGGNASREGRPRVG